MLWQRFTSVYSVSYSSHLLHSLDPEQKEALIEVLSQLLKDAHNMVLGSAIAVFNESALTRLIFVVLTGAA